MIRVNRLVLPASLCCTVLVPTQAVAAPVVSFVLGVLNTSGIATGFGASFGAFAAGVSFGSSLVGSALVQLAAVAVLSSVANRLAPRPKAPTLTPTQQMVNYAQPVSPMRWLAGTTRLGGPLALTAFADNARHYGVLIAAHSTVGPVQHYLDDQEVAVGLDGAVLTAPFVGHVSLRSYTGQAGQGADQVLLDTFSEITSADDFAGLSWVAATASRVADADFSTVYVNGREPQVIPVWQGDDQIYDPRTSSRGYTNNAALVIARWAERNGKTVDWTEIAREADACDVLIPNADGGLQRRWTINVALDDDVTWGDGLARLIEACDAWVYERADGALGLVVGRWVQPDVVLLPRDFLAVTWSDGNYGPDEVGEFVATYVEPARDYYEAQSGAVIVAPGRRETIECFACDSHNQAVRVARAAGRRSRAPMRLQGTIKLRGFEIVGKRFVAVNLTGAAPLDTVLEIEELNLNSDGQTWAITASQVSEVDFSDADANYEPARPTYANITSQDDVPVPSGLTAEVVSGSGGVAQIALAWPAQPAHLTPVLRMRQAAGEWQEIITGSGATSYLLTGLADRKTYEFQLRNRTSSLRVSDWSPGTPVSVEAIADTIPPAALPEFDVTVVGTSAQVAFTAPNDPAYMQTRIWRGESVDFAAAIAIRIEAGAPNLADVYEDGPLTPGEYFYWAEPLNGSGIAGPRSGPAEIAII